MRLWHKRKLKLPEEFADLQILADEFGIGDDFERQSVEDTASQDRKRELVNALSPRLGSINAYLDHHDDESAHLLGRLAEAACEVALEIGWSK